VPLILEEIKKQNTGRQVRDPWLLRSATRRFLAQGKRQGMLRGIPPGRRVPDGSAPGLKLAWLRGLKTQVGKAADRLASIPEFFD
jgi:hypothetical protein